MKILFCNYEYPPLGGGGGVINARLAEELAKRHSVTVLTSQAMGLEERESVNGVDVIRVPVWGRKHAAAASMVSMLSYLPVGARVGKSLLRNVNFDVINTHFVVPTGPLGAYLSRQGNIPNILTVHGGDLYDPSKASSPHRHWVLRMLIKRLLHAADTVVGQSKNTVENVQKYYVEGLPCELIPLGIERPGAPVKGRREWGFSDDDRILVTVGRLVARKAVGQLLELVSQLSDPRVELVIIGDGPMKPELGETSTELGIAEQVRFAGFVDEQDKVDLLGLSDLYVSTSQHEGFGLVFLEAMAMGLPVVCYDFGGQSDFLENGVTGALVPLNEREVFRQECERVLSSAGLRREMAANNKKKVESFYIDTCASDYEQLFERVVSHKRNSNK
jgi:glycosyltransferase involved in cell wall biosynthesis